MRDPSRLPPHMRPLHAKIRKLPLGAGMVSMLQSVLQMAAALAAMKGALDENSPMYANIDDIERSVTALLHNQVEPIVEQIQKTPDKTFEEYDVA